MQIRRADPTDAPLLTQLARIAKASWGYPEAWLAEWDADLAISPRYIRENAVFVAEVEGSAVGVVGVGVGTEGPEIGHLWVAPDAQARGLGRALVERACEVARTERWPRLRILSDPHARPFYERLGAQLVGEVPAPVAGTERTLPVLELEVRQEPLDSSKEAGG